MRVQTFRETVVKSTGAGLNTPLCVADPSRTVLIMGACSAANLYGISTKPVPTGMTPTMAIFGTNFPIPFTLTFAVHGILVQQSYFTNSGAFAGTDLAYVFELIEYDKPEPRSDGGIILQPPVAWRSDAMDQIQTDTAAQLKRAIDNARAGAIYVK